MQVETMQLKKASEGEEENAHFILEKFPRSFRQFFANSYRGFTPLQYTLFVSRESSLLVSLFNSYIHADCKEKCNSVQQQKNAFILILLCMLVGLEKFHGSFVSY